MLCSSWHRAGRALASRAPAERQLPRALALASASNRDGSPRACTVRSAQVAGAAGAAARSGNASAAGSNGEDRGPHSVPRLPRSGCERGAETIRLLALSGKPASRAAPMQDHSHDRAGRYLAGAGGSRHADPCQCARRCRLRGRDAGPHADGAGHALRRPRRDRARDHRPARRLQRRRISRSAT